MSVWLCKSQVWPFGQKLRDLDLYRSTLCQLKAIQAAVLVHVEIASTQDTHTHTREIDPDLGGK